MKLFGKKSTSMPDAEPENYATIVVTMNPKTGDIAIRGNVLQDTKLTMMMLIEAAHSVINKPVDEVKEPAITH